MGFVSATVKGDPELIQAFPLGGPVHDFSFATDGVDFGSVAISDDSKLIEVSFLPLSGVPQLGVSVGIGGEKMVLPGVSTYALPPGTSRTIDLFFITAGVEPATARVQIAEA